MDVDFIEHEPYFKFPQNPIQGERVNISEEELNFDFLDFTRYHASLDFSTPVQNNSEEESNQDLNNESEINQEQNNSEEERNHNINNESEINHLETNDTMEDQEEMIIQPADDPTRPGSPHEVSFFEQRDRKSVV